MNGQTNLRTLENVSMSPNKNEISLVVERDYLPPHEVGVLHKHTHTHTHTDTNKSEQKHRRDTSTANQQLGWILRVCVCVFVFVQVSMRGGLSGQVSRRAAERVNGGIGCDVAITISWPCLMN